MYEIFRRGSSSNWDRSARSKMLWPTQFFEHGVLRLKLKLAIKIDRNDQIEFRT